MIKGIIFDMDGLMFDTERLVIKAWDFAGKQMGYSITKDIVIKTLGLNTENTRRVFIEHLGNNFDFYVFRKIRVDYMTDYIDKNGIPIKTGLIELLDFLKSNHYKMTVATSTEKEKTEYYFKKANISYYFDDIVCGDMIERGKPEPDIYLKASKIIGVAPNECLALEDSPIGILSAYRAGMKPVMIPDLVKPNEETNKILYAKLPTLFDVIELLNNQN
jgi:HAD superfamily hydrolase (TIGR01509 family)